MITACHTYIYRMSHVWMISTAGSSSPTLPLWMRHGTHANAAWRTYECVMSHIWMRHVTGIASQAGLQRCAHRCRCGWDCLLTCTMSFLSECSINLLLSISRTRPHTFLLKDPCISRQRAVHLPPKCRASPAKVPCISFKRVAYPPQKELYSIPTKQPYICLQKSPTSRFKRALHLDPKKLFCWLYDVHDLRTPYM